MKAGPVDVIIPGISVFRRKSAGQIFEAVTRALDIPELSLQELNDKYGDEIREYDKKSEFTFLGKEFSAPCGINQFIRLDHDATSKQSFAYIKSNYNYNLHVAEMELLNLAARGYYNILNELDIRSLNKHTNALNKIVAMQKNGSISEEPMNSSYLNIYMRYLGWDMRISNKLSNEEVDARWNALVSLFPTEENEQDVDDNALAEFYAAIEEEKKRESEDDTDMIDFEWGSPIDLSDEILDNDEVDIFDMTEEQQDMGDLPAAAREYLENIEE
jgi:hypothetical protein